MSGYLKTAAIVGGTVVGGTVAVVAAPVVVAGLGFGAGGIVAGSTAASMMSWPGWPQPGADLGVGQGGPGPPCNFQLKNVYSKYCQLKKRL